MDAAPGRHLPVAYDLAMLRTPLPILLVTALALDAAPAEDIHWMTPDELDTYGFATSG